MSTPPGFPSMGVLPDFPDGYVSGFPGDLADIGLKDTISRQNRGEKPIPFGSAVTDGEGWDAPIGVAPPNHDIGCKLFEGEGRITGFAKSEYGVSAATVNPCTGTFGFGAYPVGSTVQVIRDARMRQIADKEVHPGDPVRVDDEGKVSVNGGHTVPGCTWETHSQPNHPGIIQILISDGSSGGGTPEPEDARGQQGHKDLRANRT